MPASLSRPANTGPIPSTASIAVDAGAMVVLKTGGSGSREAATEMKRSRMAQMSATAPPTIPITLASLFITGRVPTSAISLLWPA